MPPPIPYGSETLVNTITTARRRCRRSQRWANGTYVVVWQDASVGSTMRCARSSFTPTGRSSAPSSS
jgi:hypothetical protein